MSLNKLYHGTRNLVGMVNPPIFFKTILKSIALVLLGACLYGKQISR